MIETRVLQFFEEYTGRKADEFRVLAQSGSSRVNFFAGSGGRAFIITFNENLRENEAFFYFSNLFSELRLNTPGIFAVSADRKLYIQEFLGEKTLSQIIEGEGCSARVKSLVKKSLGELFHLQKATQGRADFSHTFEYPAYGRQAILHDLFYFKNFIADVLELPYHKYALLLEFEKIAALVENLGPKVLMLRDFQSRNIMVNHADEVYFIDYQSAMQGPALYDVVSFLFQAKANFPDDFKEEMLDYFISLHPDSELRLQLSASAGPLRLMRYLQVLGAYGFRGLVQRKEHFRSSLAQGIKNLTEFASEWPEMAQFPELSRLVFSLNSPEAKEKLQQLLSEFN